MFSILISEKGGETKRMEFDRPEITIGRVAGNDIVLPRNNISKRHSRIVFKDGKFIVVDLKAPTARLSTVARSRARSSSRDRTKSTLVTSLSLSRKEPGLEQLDRRSRKWRRWRRWGSSGTAAATTAWRPPAAADATESRTDEHGHADGRCDGDGEKRNLPRHHPRRLLRLRRVRRCRRLRVVCR